MQVQDQAHFHKQTFLIHDLPAEVGMHSGICDWSQLSLVGEGGSSPVQTIDKKPPVQRFNYKSPYLLTIHKQLHDYVMLSMFVSYMVRKIKAYA